MDTKILYFTGSWCGPCKTMGPLIKKFAIDHRVPLEIYDVERDVDLAVVYGVMLLPTLVKLQDGQEVSRMTGMHTSYDIGKFVSPS